MDTKQTRFLPILLLSILGCLPVILIAIKENNYLLGALATMCVVFVSYLRIRRKTKRNSDEITVNY